MKVDQGERVWGWMWSRAGTFVVISNNSVCNIGEIAYHLLLHTVTYTLT